MRTTLVNTIAFLLLALPIGASAQDAQSILEKVRDLQMERREGVDNYIIDQSIMGNRLIQLYERLEVIGADGQSYETFRVVPLDEIESRRGDNPDMMSAAQFGQFAKGAEMTGGAMSSGIEDGLAEAGLPRGLLGSSGSSSTATLDPSVMMGDSAGFLRGAGASQGAGGDGSAEAKQDIDQMAEFASTAKLVGTETVDSKSAFHLRADGLNRTQKVDGQEFTINSVELWIDTKMYVPLKMKMKGVVRSGRESRPMVMEKTDTDYRLVPDSEMYESYKQTMSIGGIMDAKQEKELREAQVQMAEFEKQLANMPASQRAMMERMMGPQLEAMKKMSAGGGFEVATEIHNIQVNTVSLPSSREMATRVFFTEDEVPVTAEYSDHSNIIPIDINAAGDGILRYLGVSGLSGPENEYWLAVGRLFDDSDRPFQAVVDGIGPFNGPRINFWFRDINRSDIPIGDIAFKIYQQYPGLTQPQEFIYEPVTRPDLAETKDACGSTDALGLCSKDRR